MSEEIILQLKTLQEWFFLNQAGNKVIYVICFFMLLAFLVVLITKKIKVPIVVGYVFLGIIFSVNTIELLPFLSPIQQEWYAFSIQNLNIIAQIALAFIAFTIGSELSVKIISKMGRSIIYIVFLQAFAAFAFVTIGLLLIGKPLYFALLFGTLATATAPAATVMVIKEYNAKGPVTSMIMAVVGIDDAIALFMFSLISPIAYILYFGEGNLSVVNSLVLPLVEIIGSVTIGLAIGYISQKLMTIFDDKTKKILLLLVTIIGGTTLSLLFHLSPLITNMAIGFAYRNFATKNLEIGEDLETITIPIYAMFFILAGTEIEFSSIVAAGFLLIAFVYTITRAIGKIGGSVLGGIFAKAPSNIKKYVGLGLLPQGGVALAMAYTIQQQFAATPHVGRLVFNVILFTAILTEVFGPLATKYAIFKAGEAKEI